MLVHFICRSTSDENKDVVRAKERVIKYGVRILRLD